MPPGKEGRICSRRAPYLSSYNGRMCIGALLFRFLCLRSLITWINLTTFSIFIFFFIPFFLSFNALVVLLLYSSWGIVQLPEGLLRCAQVRTGPCTPLDLFRWHYCFASVLRITPRSYISISDWPCCITLLLCLCTLPRVCPESPLRTVAYRSLYSIGSTPLALLLCLRTLPRVYPESTLHLRWHCSFAYVPKSTAACSTAKVLRITHRLSMEQSPRVYTASALALLLRHYIWYLLVCVFTGLTQSATRT